MFKSNYFSLSELLRLNGIFSISSLILFSFSFSPLMPCIISPEKSNIIVQDKNILFRVTILDKLTTAPIPFAHISIVGGNTYREADDNGAFTLPLKPEQENGKIRVTALGYVSQEFSIADLVKQHEAAKVHKLFLVPDYKNLQVVEVNAKARKWKIKKAGYHIDEGSAIHYELYPSDTLTIGGLGHEIGNKIQLNKYPAALRSVSFGLQGLSGERLKVRIRLYSLKNNLPHLNLLPELAIIAIPSHHAGWITVNLQQYHITLKEDFVVVVEWDGSKEHNTRSLMAFATLPKGQITYFRESHLKPWKIINSTLVDIKSIGMYATVLYEK